MFGISTLTVFEVFRFPGMTQDESEALHRIISLCEVFSVSAEVAHRGATISKTRPNKRAIDILIAATALELGVPLITKNLKDFHRIPGLTIQTAP